MRVLHVFKDYFPPTRGGIEQHIHEVTHSLLGYKFAVLTSSGSKERVVEDDDGVRVVRTPELFRPVSTPITPSWSKFLKDSGADLAHFHVPNPYGEIEFLRARTELQMVATYHADIVGRAWLKPFFKPFQSSFLSKASRIIVSNPRLLATSPALAKHQERCMVIPFGIDPGEWDTRPDAADAIKERYPGPLLVFLGRLAYYKGVDLLIEAMLGIDATLLIIGDGPLRTELKRKTASLHLRHKVIFTGEVPDEERKAYLHAADMFVLPSTSRAETFGISMLQAMACGTPAISTELGTGTSWVNEDSVTGIVVEPGTGSALSDAILALLRDRERLADMGLAAAERVRTHFTKYQMLESLASLYASI